MDANKTPRAQAMADKKAARKASDARIAEARNLTLAVVAANRFAALVLANFDDDGDGEHVDASSCGYCGGNGILYGRAPCNDCAAGRRVAASR